MNFLGSLHVTDFQLIYVCTRGGPLNATHLMATLSFQRAIPGGNLGEGAALAMAMVPFPPRHDPVLLFGLQRRAWQRAGVINDPRAWSPEAQAKDSPTARSLQ